MTNIAKEEYIMKNTRKALATLLTAAAVGTAATFPVSALSKSVLQNSKDGQGDKADSDIAFNSCAVSENETQSTAFIKNPPIFYPCLIKI